MVDQPTEKTEIFLSLGSNINPEENLQFACRELKKTFGNIQVSSEIDNKTLKNEAANIEGVKKHLKGKDIIKKIVIPGRVVNFVVK